MRVRGSQPWRTNRARLLRDTASGAARVMWSKLRNRQLGGYKFVREFPIGPYFADFACREAMLVVEIDGDTHSTADELTADAEREHYLKTNGYRVFRVWNRDVYANVNGVCDALLATLDPTEPTVGPSS